LIGRPPPLDEDVLLPDEALAGSARGAGGGGGAERMGSMCGGGALRGADSTRGGGAWRVTGSLRSIDGRGVSTEPGRV
jgi:hypothetical protein